VANPVNTNCLIAQMNAPKISPTNFSCLSRLDQNRATGQVAAKLNVNPKNIKNLIIWGNHSATMVPDVSCASFTGDNKLEGHVTKHEKMDHKWLEEEFVKTVQQRGAKVIETRGASSALSAAKAIADHMRDWLLGSEGNVVSMGIYSDGSYGIAKGIFYSFPVITHPGGSYKIVQDINVSGYESLLKKTEKELLSEKADLESLTSS